MKTTNDNLLEQIDYLISEVLVIKEILIPRIKKPEEVPKYLSVEEAIALSLEKRIPMSFSKLYKLTATNGIPYNKAGNKLDIPVKMTSLLRMKLTTHTRLSPSYYFQA